MVINNLCYFLIFISQVRLMISDSELSDEFSLDTVGSHGDVKCKGKYKDYLVRMWYTFWHFLWLTKAGFVIKELYNHYCFIVLSVWPQVGVKIDASSFSLTRVVTFVPFYMLVNRTKHTVFVCEEDQNSWTEAGPEQVRAKPNIVDVSVSLHILWDTSELYWTLRPCAHK